MLSLLMLAALCCFVQGDEILLQVDDTHVLYADGEQISSGNSWNKIYSVNRDSYYVLAIYAQNTFGGPKGVALNIHPGWPTPDYWFCQTVNSLDDAPDGWNTRGFSNEGFKRAVVHDGSSLKLDGAEWFWSVDGGDKIICRVDFSVAMKIQVDGQYELYDSSGLISTGNKYSKVYEAEASNYLAIYAYNGAGPNGILLAINNDPIEAAEMRCKAVSGSKAAIDADNPGWKEPGFNDSQWPLAGPSQNPVKASLPGAPVLWAANSNSATIICRVKII